MMLVYLLSLQETVPRNGTFWKKSKRQARASPRWWSRYNPKQKNRPVSACPGLLRLTCGPSSASSLSSRSHGRIRGLESIYLPTHICKASFIVHQSSSSSLLCIAVCRAFKAFARAPARGAWVGVLLRLLSEPLPMPESRDCKAAGFLLAAGRFVGG